MKRLILTRHGQSVWNLENIFTGWADVDLSEKGEAEAREAGELLVAAKISFDIAYVSYLRRAIDTLHLMAKSANLEWVEECKTWRLNERHYGALQGLNKAETAKQYSEEQVLIWRRSFDVPPPQLKSDDSRSPRFDSKYASLSDAQIPVGESLKATIARTLPYWESDIAPSLCSGKDVLVVAHGNSLRGLVKVLENIGDSEISKVEIPTGNPLVYELDDNLKPLRKFYLKK